MQWETSVVTLNRNASLVTFGRLTVEDNELIKNYKNEIES